MVGRLIQHACKNCGGPFTGHRLLKYCSAPCRKEGTRAHQLAYERRVKRPPHLYRKKQLELTLDTVQKDPYKDSTT